MSGCFDGRNGKSVKTSGDLKDLRDLQFEDNYGSVTIMVRFGDSVVFVVWTSSLQGGDACMS